jgi:hypothetical protein
MITRCAFITGFTNLQVREGRPLVYASAFTGSVDLNHNLLRYGIASEELRSLVQIFLTGVRPKKGSTMRLPRKSSREPQTRWAQGNAWKGGQKGTFFGKLFFGHSTW